MADQLKSIVQRMIDAGEPEDNIATVIQHFKSQSAPSAIGLAAEAHRTAGQPMTDAGVDAPEPDTWWGGFTKGLAREFLPSPEMARITPQPTRMENAKQLLPYAMPAAPEVASGVGEFVGRSVGALKTAAQDTSSVGRLLSLPARAIGKFNESLPSQMAKDIQKFRGAPTAPTTPRSVAIQSSRPDVVDRMLGERPTPAATEMSPTGFTAAERAQLVKQNYTPETIARMEAQITPAASHVQSFPEVNIEKPRLPVSSSELGELNSKLTKQIMEREAGRGVPNNPVAQALELERRAIQPMASHAAQSSPLRQPRIEQGAERVGRAEGLTKEHVRQQTGPVLDETVGDASPILPEKTLRQIIDKMKALPRGGPEREAYVQAATSGKTKAQVENIRRTLEHLGLIVPVAATVGRDALLRQMRGSLPAGSDGQR